MFGYVPIKLCDVVSYSTTRIKAENVDEFNYVGVDNLLQQKQGKITANHIPTEVCLIQYNCEDTLIGNIRPYLRKIWFADNNGGTNGDVLVIRTIDNKIVLPRYLFHVLSKERFFVYDNQNSKGAKMPRGDKKAVMGYALFMQIR